ncbi:SpoIIE family protein phosphatase [Sulfitobacter albidus]|uniref:SpoIIE family protein phosphatase n=1 Tax=Sulfitobacter albidus TaxID=2829501 RepID=A0A975JDR3_9RHOB|nr:SpoIIE family protein phosphatase [Sulfitobacter albidus]QUJ76200.1 SpoIIE family protein phosphatase [Sulfitobacter albidus]
MLTPAQCSSDPIPALHEGAIRHVLVVDDSRLQRKILTASLTRWGFQVTEAASGDEALDKICALRPDLVLSDWVMPGMSGPELCRRVRADAEAPYCYFILLTTKSEKAEVAHGLDSGADDFLTKPVDSNELRARITAGERLLELQRNMAMSNRALSETLDELQRLHDHIDKDLQEAKRLQQSLIRERFRQFDAGNLSLMLRSSGHVGGDLVGFFDAGADHLGLFAIDVSGHGISSALMTARLAGYLSSAAPDQNVALERDARGALRPRAPDLVVAEMNDLVLDEMETEHYFTLLLGHVALGTGRVTLCQAGHPHPAVQRRDGRIDHFGPGGFPVGLLSGVQFEAFEFDLTPGDRMLILSDGVTECPGPDGALLEEEGLTDLMNSLREVSGPPFLEALIWKLTEFNGSDDFPDDVSAILFEYAPQPKA